MPDVVLRCRNVCMCVLLIFIFHFNPPVSDVPPLPHLIPESQSGAEEPLSTPQPLEDKQEEEDSAVVEYNDPYAEEDPPWAPRTYMEKGKLQCTKSPALIHTVLAKNVFWISPPLSTFSLNCLAL